MLENLAEEIRKLRSELSRRLADLENRVKHLEETRDPSYMVELVWRIACIEASAQRLLSHARNTCLLYTSPSPRDLSTSRMPSSA